LVTKATCQFDHNAGTSSSPVHPHHATPPSSLTAPVPAIANSRPGNQAIMASDDVIDVEQIEAPDT
jgi:hypothetical protein